MKMQIEIQKENTNELFELIKNNPDLPIFPMVTAEIVCSDDYAYWMGSWGRAEVDSFYIHEDHFVYLSDGVNDIFDDVFDDKLEMPEGLTEEEEDKFINDAVMGLDWTEAIIVRIELPN